MQNLQDTITDDRAETQDGDTPANIKQSTVFDPEPIIAALDVLTRYVKNASDAVDAIVAQTSLGELIAATDAFKAAVQQGSSELIQKAKAQEAVDKLKQMLLDGVTDPEELMATLAASRPVSTKRSGNSVRNPYPKAPAIYTHLAYPDHHDYEWGYKDSLRGLSAPKTPWAIKKGKKADPAFFRKAEPDDIAEMTKRREAYIAKVDADREACAAKKI